MISASAERNEFALEPLRRRFEGLVRALTADSFADMPDWVRADPAAALVGKKFVICGSTMTGELRDAIRRLPVIAVVDDRRRQAETEIDGVPLVSTDEWLRMATADRTIVSLIFVPTAFGHNHFRRCCSQHELATLGALDYFRLVAGATGNLLGVGTTFVYGLSFYRHTLANAEELLARASVFDDDYSRFTYFCVLLYRLTGDPNYLAACAVGNAREHAGYNTYMFNHSFFELTENEVYVDGGAFDGDTIASFVRAVDGKFRRAYVFEPSPALADRCEQRIQGLPSADRISLIRKGLWSRTTSLHFNPNLFSGDEAASAPASPLSAHIVESGITSHLYQPEVEQAGGFTIDVTTVDEQCTEPVTLLKLEIEGSELEALHGSIRTIQAHRPRMAISIYHKPEDLLTLPRFVQDTKMGYRMSLRLHNPHVPDAMVCYCR